MDYKNSVGKLSYRLYGILYQIPMCYLHELKDVFLEWLDDYEAAERNSGTVVSDTAAIVGSENFEEYDKDKGDELDAPSRLDKRKKASSSSNTDSKASLEK